MIFFFTGTGNSLYVARRLACALCDRAVSIPQALHDEDACYADVAIGLVVPVYGHELPHMVVRFLERSRFSTGYCYAVLTYGARHGDVVDHARRAVAETGAELAYARTLLMVDNWLPEYDMDEERSIEKDVEGQIERILDDLKVRRCFIEPVTDADRQAHQELRSWGLSFTPADLADSLEIRGSCQGCGVCARVCPAGCIRMADASEPRRAVRDGRAGFGCAGCLACIQSCPHGAISIPGGEKNPDARYLNENIRLSELMEANAQPFADC